MYGGPAAYGESMTKKDLGGKNCLYPMPVFLVGAEVEGVVDFTTVAHVGILNVGEVNYVSIGLGKGHHVNRGIKANREFSLCLPSEDMMVAVDHCGIASGARVELCHDDCGQHDPVGVLGDEGHRLLVPAEEVDEDVRVEEE